MESGHVSPLFENEAFDYHYGGYSFLRLSHLQLGNLKAALLALDQVSRISSSDEDAEGYTVKMSDLERSKVVIQRIARSNQAKKDTAIEILELIAKF